jgi:hypothetical protein
VENTLRQKYPNSPSSPALVVIGSFEQATRRLHRASSCGNPKLTIGPADSASMRNLGFSKRIHGTISNRALPKHFFTFLGLEQCSDLEPPRRFEFPMSTHIKHPSCSASAYFWKASANLVVLFQPRTACAKLLHLLFFHGILHCSPTE